MLSAVSVSSDASSKVSRTITGNYSPNYLANTIWRSYKQAVPSLRNDLLDLRGGFSSISF